MSPLGRRVPLAPTAARLLRRGIRRRRLEEARQTLRHNALANRTDRGARASEPVWESCQLQSSDPRFRKLLQSSQLGAQHTSALRRNTIVSPALFSRQWFNPTLLL